MCTCTEQRIQRIPHLNVAAISTFGFRSGPRLASSWTGLVIVRVYGFDDLIFLRGSNVRVSLREGHYNLSSLVTRYTNLIRFRRCDGFRHSFFFFPLKKEKFPDEKKYLDELASLFGECNECLFACLFVSSLEKSVRRFRSRYVRLSVYSTVREGLIWTRYLCLIYQWI